MKFLIVLAVVIATASAQAILGAVTTGRSDVSRSDDGLGNYAFGYNEDHAFGGTFRKEKGGPGVKIGSYGLREADGRMRVVNYVADGLGFRASVSTNEPGTDIKQDPAAVSMNLGHVAAPVAVAAAPVAMAAPAIAAATPVVAKAFDARFDAPIIAAKAFGDPRFDARFDAPLIAKSFAGPAIMAKTFDAGLLKADLMAKTLAAPIMAKAIAPMAVAAPITASSYATHTQHIAAPKMIAAAAPLGLATPFAKSFVF